MNPFHYYAEYRVLICKSCQYAVQPNHIAAHLRADQHKLSRQQSHEIASQYTDTNLADPSKESIVPNSIIAPLDDLPIYRDGLACQHCSYICRSINVMQRHQRQMHQQRIGRGRRLNTPAYESAWCQCFYTGVGQRYFRVQQVVHSQDNDNMTDNVSQLVHQQLDEKEKIEKEKRNIIRDGEETEVSSWLDRTQWIRHLEGQDKATVVQWIRPAQSEEVELQEVEKSIERIVEQGRQTILQKKVSIFVLQRLESFQPGQDAQKPFHVNIGSETVQRYQRVWQALLLYVLRTADNEQQLYQYTKQQRHSVRDVKLAASQFQMHDMEELQEDEIEYMRQELDKRCLELCIALLDHQLDHDEYESAVVSFLAVIGLENVRGSEGYRFKDAVQYMVILSGFIKVGQMLVLQYCYKQEEDCKVKSCRQLLEKLHTECLTVSSATPMDWALRLRLYGRGISRRMTMEGCINWIGDTVICNEVELSMEDFRQLIQKLVEETENILLQELLFVQSAGELPSYSWTELKDNAAKDEPGWNFIQDKRNGMMEYRRWLLNRILQRPEVRQEFMIGTGVWRQRRVNDWCDKQAEFLEKLLALIHMTGGQPARAKELLSVRYCNTEKGGYRSVFVENGLLGIVTYYHKGYNITGTEKIIHRYLPEEVGDLLLRYIWLVLPLRQQLDKLVLGNEEIQSAFLWTSDRGKRWTRERVAQVLKRESDRLIGVRLNMQTYRHIAIAISDRYMKRKFDKENDKQDKDEDDHQDEALAKQSGHTPETAGSTYARFLQEAPSHVQTMRYRFRIVSIEWHAVLQLNTRLQQHQQGLQESGPELGVPVRGRLGGDLKRMWQGVEHEKSPGPRIRRWQSLRQTDLQAAVEELLGKGTQFRGKQQTALRAIMDGKSPVIVVMRTGGGKSLMFMLPASVKEAGTTVVVTPLIALKQDMQRRCRELGLECVEWEARRKMHDSCILLVTPESAISQGFMNHMRKLQAMDRLDRIVIDECHILLNTRLDFRRKLQKLRKVVEFAVQLVLLTATLPISKESELLSMISIEAPVMFREHTTRHSIAYAVQRCQAEHMDEVVMQLVGRQEYGRVIVYGGRVEYCRKLADMLNCKAYFAEAIEKTEALKEWIEGKSRVIVGTNALGLGIDVADVRLVLHVGGIFNLLDYGQESGRAGRDGKRSEARILVTEGKTGNYKNMEERLMWEYLQTESCRRIKLDQYMDGNLEMVECVEGQEMCDNCERGRELLQEVERTQEAKEICEEEDDEGVDERAMIMAADMAEYEEQNKKQKEQQKGYRQSRMKAADEIAGLKRVLEKLIGRCVYCVYHGLEGEEHVLEKCEIELGCRAWEIYCESKKKIKYARYAACWGCGCGQWICGAWLKGGNKQCRYEDIVLAGVVVGVMGTAEKKGRGRVFSAAGEEIKSEEELLKWLGSMGGIHGKQVSKAMVIFNMLYNDRS